MSTPSSICIYPISPSYALLHRTLYYTSLILSVIYPTPPPLIKGAFAYSLTYSSIAALYAILILALPHPTTSEGQIINLDIPALWAVLSPASILLLPLLTWSRSLQSSARPIIRIWGILVLVGAACTFALLQQSQSNINSLDESTGLNCSVLATAAEAQKLKLRDPNSVLSVSYDRIFGPLYSLLATRLAPLTFIPLFFGALPCLITIATSIPSKSPQTETWHGVEISTTPTTTSPLGPFLNVFLTLRLLILYLSPYLLLPVLIVNEVYLLMDWATSTGIPEAEKVFEVGQWGLWAGLGLVSAAAGVNWLASNRMREVTQVGEVGDGTDDFVGMGKGKRGEDVSIA